VVCAVEQWTVRTYPAYSKVQLFDAKRSNHEKNRPKFGAKERENTRKSDLANFFIATFFFSPSCFTPDGGFRFRLRKRVNVFSDE
jgi:hypothetical protein